MGHHQEAVETDPKALASAQDMWGKFTNLVKYSTLAVIIVLLGMAFTLV